MRFIEHNFSSQSNKWQAFQFIIAQIQFSWLRIQGLAQLVGVIKSLLIDQGGNRILLFKNEINYRGSINIICKCAGALYIMLLAGTEELTEGDTRCCI
ncbi:MAG: hypothetical protein COA96_07490 [SAR86 cluster bacterium]|uniref:Uncharacterized protein n=1 Tax=SAR86 cluster bacterium TaxID=2030880 RepID=A0A2A5B199_9GAMM|nr:MAG: hypothetical protein COA96_07490 [SAR86 cluster bacterium]